MSGLSLNQNLINGPSRVMGLGTQTRLRGLSILMVVMGHSVLQVLHEASPNEQVVLAAIAKFCAPSLLIFVYLIGYGQGLKKNRIRRSELGQRFQQLMLPYFFWASVAFGVYLLMEEGFRYPVVAHEALSERPYMVKYLFSISTFTISMQHYFMPVLFFFQWYAYMIRIQSEYLLLLTFKYIFVLQWLMLAGVTLFVWFLPVEMLDLGILGGGFIYRNVLVWGSFFYIGYIMGAIKRSAFPALKYKWSIFLLLWGLSTIEILVIINRSGNTFVTDMFTLFGILFALISLLVWAEVAEKTGNGQENKKASRMGKALSLYGKYSLIIYLIHLPFQWYILVFFEHLIRFDFSVFTRVAILFLSGISFPYAVINLSRKVKPRFRRILIGF